jgi:ubiquinone biosynthesis protein COQ9
LTLAAIYKSTEFFMIQDKSENFKETNAFLDNRLNDLEHLNKFKDEVIQMEDILHFNWFFLLRFYML